MGSHHIAHRGIQLKPFAVLNYLRFGIARSTYFLCKALDIVLEGRDRADKFVCWSVLQHAAADHPVEEPFGVVTFRKALGSVARLCSFADVFNHL